MGVADALTSPAGVPHGGIVTFKDGSTVIGTTSVDLRGRATLVISTLQASGNPHTITAVYGGNGNFSPSTSNSLVYTITQGANAGARAVPTSSSPLTKTMATSFAAAAPGVARVVPSPGTLAVAVQKSPATEQQFAALAAASVDGFFVSLPRYDRSRRLAGTLLKAAPRQEDWFEGPS